MAARPGPGDNGPVKASRPAWVIDTAIAAAATVAAVWVAIAQSRGAGPYVVFPREVPHQVVQGVPGWLLIGIAMTTAPLAFRRQYPAAAFAVLFGAMRVADDSVT